MKYILIFQLFLGSLFAHGHDGGHIHFFSSLHVEYFVAILAVLTCTYLVYEKIYKKSN